MYSWTLCQKPLRKQSEYHVRRSWKDEPTLCQGHDWKAFWAWFRNAKRKAHTIFKIVNELCATVGKHNESNAFRHCCFACKAPSAHYLEDVLRCSMHWFCTNMSWKHSMKNLYIAGHCAKSLSESSRNTMFAEAGRTNSHAVNRSRPPRLFSLSKFIQEISNRTHWTDP